ncbi:unnamed protein product [Peronospora destructor]|uniref:Thioredoxin-like fold domain-containing protein n=1 Tax=Peronospora destructor TaxID=86335 RepID=A0AAV0VCX6_9STRA|nr:unnamed protein product [Peronospora destructor]
MYKLVYLTSAWVQPVNETLLPKLRAVLDDINAQKHEQKLIELLKIHRISDGDSTSDVIGQRLEPVTFRSLCKQLQVTKLPACVLLDATGQALTQESLQHLEDQREIDAALTCLADSRLSC